MRRHPFTGDEFGMPRSPRELRVRGLLTAVLVLLWFSPLTLVTWIAAQWGIARQLRWQWQRFALVAAAALVTVVAVLGPAEAARLHFHVPAHFWEYAALYLGFGPDPTPSPFLLFGDLLATQAWLGIPLGVLAGAITIGVQERAAGGAEWHPLVQRRKLVDQRATERRVTRLLAHPDEDRPGGPPLGVAIEGDLAAWRDGNYAILPPGLRGKGMAVIGAPGSGKTVTLLRLAYIAGVMGRKVAFADCKGTDPNLVPQLIAAYLLGRPDARIGLWPAAPMDMWRGTPPQIVSRLLAVETFTEPWYQRVASATLRLALTAPDLPPVRSSEELLARLDADELRQLWHGRPIQERDVKAVAEGVGGVRLRYADFFGALAGAFDRGQWSFEDVDLAVLTVPTLLSKAEADAAMRVVLEDYGHYATGRKPREGEDALLIVDEFSALQGGVDAAINLAERVRDVGVQVVVAAQSVQGLGSERQAARLLAACSGGVIVHQTADPEPLLNLAGNVREVEHQWSLDEHGASGTSKARMRERPRVDPEQVRAAVPGEAWAIQAGRSLHLRVLRPPTPAAPAQRHADEIDDRPPVTVVESPSMEAPTDPLPNVRPDRSPVPFVRENRQARRRARWLAFRRWLRSVITRSAGRWE